MAEKAAPELHRTDYLIWLRRLEAEYGNLREILAWNQAQQGDPQESVRLAAALVWFWQVSNHMNEGCEWLRAVLTQPRFAGRGSERAWMLFYTTGFAWAQGNIALAHTLVSESVSIWHESADNDIGLPYAMIGLGAVFLQVGDLMAARSIFEDCVIKLRAISDHVWLRVALSFLVDTLRALGDQAAMRAYAEEMLAVAQTEGGGWLLAHAFQKLAGAFYYEGNYAAAVSRLEEVLAIQEFDGAPFSEGHPYDAAYQLEEMLIPVLHTGDKWMFSWMVANLAEVFFAQRAYERTRLYYE